MIRIILTKCLIVLPFYFAISANAEPHAYVIGSKKVSVDKVYKENKEKFFKLEKEKFELIERIAIEKYLEKYWADMGKKNGTTAAKAREQYLGKNAVVSDAEIKKTLGRFSNHPSLKELSDSDKNKQVRDHLTNVKAREATDKIIQDALAAKKFAILYPQPQAPVFDVRVKTTDAIKYGPTPNDTKPLGCSGSKCAITVVEYSEYQCPFCERVLPSVRQLMEEYKGKVRWIVRDFPLGFHNRARPAALAAQCAKQQGKFWHMYEELFKNQRALEDKDFKKYAKNIKLDEKKFEECYSKPKPALLAVIDENHKSGEKLGVTGTPAFFINGRRLSGALPYAEFKRVFEDELKKIKR